MSAPDVFAIWDWESGAPPPSARVVVCRPGLTALHHRGAADAVLAAMDATRLRGATFIVCAEDAELVHAFSERVIPALYAERQADLAGVSTLLSLQAERRALVLCPREELEVIGAWGDAWRREGAIARPIDLVIIIPPPGTRTCLACRGRCTWCGHPDCDETHACETCSGTGRIEPWPVHASWVRSIVGECRAAGTPAAFLGWGPWCPISDVWPPPPKGTEERFVWRRRANDPDDLPIICFLVGTERAGRTLDDEEVMEVPPWL